MMEKQNMNDHNRKVIEYYEKCEVSYRDIWDLDRSYAMHYAFWDEKARDFRSALRRMNEVMACKAGVCSSDRVFDAGCGIGGSAVFLASEYNCHVTGISLVFQQIATAKELSQKYALDHKLEFLQGDFLFSGFKKESFDVVWAIESVCYAQEKSDFISEAYRLLKKGGRLIIADGFYTGKIRGVNEKMKFRTWFDAWAMPDIDQIDVFVEKLKKQGFSDISVDNITGNVLRSSLRLYRWVVFALIYTRVLRFLGIKYGNRNTIANAQGAKIQYPLIKKDFWNYYIVCAIKK
jgi:tocopherol O-methyltransferase